MVLGGDQEPFAAGHAVVDDRGDVDDAGMFFVDGLELGRARGKAATIGFEDLDGGGLAERLGGLAEVHDPVLGDIGVITRVFLDVEFTVFADGEVVEGGRLGAVQAGHVGGVDDDADVAARGQEAVRGVAVEVELIDLRGDRDAVHRCASGGEEQGIVVKPVGIFGAGELGRACGGGRGLEFGAGLGGDGAIGEDRGQEEGAVDARGSFIDDGAGIARRGVDLDAVDLTVGQAGLLDGVAGVGLRAEVKEDFARGGVVGQGDRGLEQVGRAGADAVAGAREGVFPGILTEVGEFVHLAGIGAGHNPGEGLAFDAGFFAVHEDTAVITVAGAGIPEGGGLG